jgi:hypothetical protein
MAGRKETMLPVLTIVRKTKNRERHIVVGPFDVCVCISCVVFVCVCV